ncbi:type IV pilus inner membrane component PilO [Thalassoroseus pseudoceratinae]|uniref:type 4a pilus biogenesis protein PilO n=1 Tax=Thalassoroseus pseudoceratinae TaxID=2713176 RepID=UPI001422313B|nr:type 4a pilus biogenesis protein PilO [Thalassoroseus pseudoceratinae]
MSTDSLMKSFSPANSANRWILPVDWIGGGLVLGIVVATVWTVLSPLADARSDLAMEIDTHRAILAQTDKIHSDFREMTSQMEAQRRQLQQLTRMVPDRPSESEFLAQLSDLANHSGVQLLQFEPQRSISHDPHSEISVRCSAQATYPALCRFLLGLNDLPRLTDVTRLVIRQSQSPDDTSRLSMELEISIFYL